MNIDPEAFRVLWRHAHLMALAALVAAIVAGAMVFAYRHCLCLIKQNISCL